MAAAPSPLVSAFLFPVPTPSYTPHSFPGELLWIPQSLDYSSRDKGECVPAVLLLCPNARYLVLYLHSNGEDLGLSYYFASGLRALLEVHVLIVEYPGYGIYGGRRPSEESLSAVADLSFRFVTDVLGIPSSDIILMGRSLGAALATQL
ncbi:unnamed protein product, partial [Polarella glacialis]